MLLLGSNLLVLLFHSLQADFALFLSHLPSLTLSSSSPDCFFTLIAPTVPASENLFAK